MSYQEKKTMVSMITAIIIFGAYCIYTYGKVQSVGFDTDQMKFWAGTMLLFIGIGIVAAIVIQIIFHILLSIALAIQEKVRNGEYDDKEIEKTIELNMIADEMDKLIELKSDRVGYVVVGIGFITALASQLFNYSSAVMLNIIFVSFYSGLILGSLVQLYYYKKGVNNG